VQQQAKDYRLLQMKKILSKFLITFVKGGLIEAWGRGTIKIIKENRNITNKIYQEICEVSKATATRDLTELIEKFKLLERSGEVGAGTSYKLIGS
jgi:hypothetical protein